jgi:hypothetical protein
MKRLFVALAALPLLCLQACTQSPMSSAAPDSSSVKKEIVISPGIKNNTDSPPVKNEIVMSPGMKITATTPNGTIAVSAGNGLTRSYTWDGATRSVEMWPRTERWYGSLGLYYPGPGFHWKEHDGIARGVLEEGQQHFKTVDEALKWIRAQNSMPHVYTKTGLVIGWMKVLSRKQLNVDVWQIYINGRKPTNLPGSQNGKILVTYPKAPERK